MKKIIEEIWNGDFFPFEFYGTPSPEMKKAEKIMYENLEKLVKNKENSNKEIYEEIYEEFHDSLHVYIGLCLKNAFCDGFSVGLKLTAESFADADRLMHNNE